MGYRMDRSYLEWHGQQWRVQVKVPLRLRGIVGKKRLVMPLHTDSLAVANREKHKHVAAFKELLLKAEAKLSEKTGKIDPLLAEAADWRSRVQQEEASSSPAIASDYDDIDHTDVETLAQWLITDRTEEIARSEGPDRAALFYGVATGQATPLETLVDKWISEIDMKPRQKLDYARAVRKFAAWLKESRLSSEAEAIDRKTAGRYVSKLIKDKVHPRTTNKDISCLSSMWKWMEKRGYVSSNIWTGQSVKQPKAKKGEAKRPYTDAEIAKLLDGKPAPFLHDAIMIAALSGMRVEEIARLKIEDIGDGCMHIRTAKTIAGERAVPIHSRLLGIIERRCKDKQPPDYMFDELPTPEADSAVERSQKISKRFTAYRRELGVDDLPEGARQSRVDFHSLRRWFIHKVKAEITEGAQGFTAWTLAEVVGHSKEEMPLGMTMGRYPGDDSIAAKRKCVETVQLP